MARDLQLTLLGTLQIELEGQALADRMLVKGQALLAYLAVTGQQHGRAALADLLWSGMPDKTARTNLRVVLSRLRKTVGPHLSVTRRTVVFNRHTPYRLDVADFETAIAAGHWRDAADLYGGDFLGDFYVPDAPVFEEWALVERERLRQLALDALSRLVEEALQRRLWVAGIRDARRLLALEPWRESAHRQLITLLVRSGERSAALAQYEICRQVLAQELGVEPSAETKALVEKIKTGVVSPPPQLAPPAGIPPALPVSPPHNLPAPATSFVGRQAEQAQIADLLADAGCRLLSVIGPGGVGKSRLALAAATAQLASQSPFSDGIYFVSLAAVMPADGDEDVAAAEPVALAIGEAIGLSFSGAESPQTQLLQALRRQHLLLVLDNFEHLTGQASLLVALLEQAPGLKLLVTSRESLNLYEEWVLELPGLAYPPADDAAGPGVNFVDAGQIGANIEGTPPAASLPASPSAQPPAAESFDSVALFIQRARRVYLRFAPAQEQTAIRRICRLLEGVPLGIELAAAWVRTLSCREIAAEIERNLDFLASTTRNVPDRQRSLRAAFEHSWQLLTAAEQEILPRLTVFRGGFTGQAAAAIAGARLRVLSGLVEKSLVQRTAAGRYEVHELLRQYGAEMLSDPAAVNRRHAQFFADMLHRQEAAIRHGQPPAIEEAGQEIENLRAAWAWGIEQQNEETVAMLLAGLASFYELRGWFQSGLVLLEQAASAVGDSPLLRSRWLDWQARFHDHLGRHEQARACATKSVGLVKQEDTMATAYASALGEWGFALSGLGENAQAETVLAESLHLFETLGDQAGQARIHYYQVFVATDLGRRQQALACLEESLRLYRCLDHWRGMAECLYLLGNFNIGFGNYAQAKTYYHESQNLHETIGNRVGVANCLMNHGLAALCAGQLDEAEEACRASLQLFTKFGKQPGIRNNLNNLGKIARQRGELALAREYLAKSLALRRTIDEQLPIALTLAYFGNVTASLQEVSTARAYFREALEIALKTKALLVLNIVLVELAPFLADQGRPVLAVETLTRLVEHPDTEQYVRSQAEQALHMLKSTLTPDLLVDRVPENTRDFETLARDILAWMPRTN